MSMRNWLLFNLLLTFSVSQLLAQPTDISEKIYSDTYFAAMEKANEYSRRHITKSERFRNGKVFEAEEWLQEFMLPFTTRKVETLISIGGASRTEMVDLGESLFCKNNNGAWEKVSTPCLIGPKFIQVLGVVSSQYGVETVKLDNYNVKIFSDYRKYKNSRSPNADSEGLSFMETKYWLNDEGLVFRRKIRIGLLATQKISYETVETYEYNPSGLKIEAPAK